MTEAIDPIKAGILDSIAGSLRKREGFRHLWLGDSGQGKTEANKKLIEWSAPHVDIILTLDDKSRWNVQYPGGSLRVNPNHLRAQPPKPPENPRHIVFRGISASGKLEDHCDANEVAQLGWDLVRLRPCSVLINIDELADATNGHQSWNAETAPQLYRKGRGVGLSVTATTQLPQLLPREAFGLSDSIGIFRMSGREASYLYKYNVIAKEQVAEIEALQIGEFRFIRKPGGLDPRTFKFRL